MRAESTIEMTASDVVWGAKQIGEVIGRNERQAFYLLEKGHIPCARKFAKNWAASRQALLQMFLPEAA